MTLNQLCFPFFTIASSQLAHNRRISNASWWKIEDYQTEIRDANWTIIFAQFWEYYFIWTALKMIIKDSLHITKHLKFAFTFVMHQTGQNYCIWPNNRTLQLKFNNFRAKQYEIKGINCINQFEWATQVSNKLLAQPYFSSLNSDSHSTWYEKW